MDATPLPRALEASLRAALADTPVVCLLGPRQCGKTTLARALAPRYGYVSFDDADALAQAQSDPNGFLAALPDRVILDEIQRVPELLRALKLSVDRDRRPGRFLLTGSANLLLLPKLGDSLAGRMAILELQPLTAAEQARKPGGFLAAWLGGKLKPAFAASPQPAAACAGGVGDSVTLAVRPERMLLELMHDEGLPGTVLDSAYRGDTQVARVRLANGALVRVARFGADAALIPERGAAVRLSIPPDAARALPA
jgi:predicted AAA+ superfamily ATPase